MTEQEIIDQRYAALEKLCRKPRWGWLQWSVVVLLAAITVGVAIPAFNGIAAKSRMMWASSNGRMILISLKSYAGDHDGTYPEGATSNDAFREIFKAGMLDDERPFTTASSPYVPDNNIGIAPDFKEALKPGENHWAMTKGLSDESSGNAPLVFENPAVASWPPYWDASVNGASKPGRAWRTGKIIIGRNDGSVNGEALADDHSERVTVAPMKDGKNLFEVFGTCEVLNIAK